MISHTSIGYEKSKFRLIPNGFDTLKFSPNNLQYQGLRESLGLPKQAMVVGMLARFDPIKNHQGFIQAAACLHATKPGVHYVMVGKDVSPENVELQELVRQAGLTNHVHLLGLRVDIPEILAGFDVLALTSWSEGFPTVIGEAMASGVPCVATDVGDARYIIADTGSVVNPGDMRGIAESIAKLLDLPQSEREEMGRKARQRVVDNFALTDVVHKYNSLFDEALTSIPNFKK
ncbi:hypothetical protein YWS52_27240 [Chitiniphilus shinanonensis]